jgi:hypothetical protein
MGSLLIAMMHAIACRVGGERADDAASLPGEELPPQEPDEG